MIFKDILQEVTRTFPVAKAEEIRYEVNSCLRYLSTRNLLKAGRLVNTTGSYSSIGAVIGGVEITSKGSGYDGGSVTFTGGTGIEATGTYKVGDDGDVISIEITSGGDYDTPPTGIVLQSAGGSDFAGTIILSNDAFLRIDEVGFEVGQDIYITESVNDNVGLYDILEVVPETAERKNAIRVTLLNGYAQNETGSYRALNIGTKYNLPDDVISVFRVFVDGRWFRQNVRFETFMEPGVPSNKVYVNPEDRSLNFGEELTSENELSYHGFVMHPEMTDPDPNFVIHFPDRYKSLFIAYVNKQLAVYDNYFNENKYSLFNKEFNDEFNRAFINVLDHDSISNININYLTDYDGRERDLQGVFAGHDYYGDNTYGYGFYGYYGW